MDLYVRGGVFEPISVSKPGIGITWNQMLVIVSRYLAVVSVTIQARDAEQIASDLFEGELVRMIRRGHWLYFDSTDFDLEPVEMLHESPPNLFADNGCIFFQYDRYHYAIYPS